MGFVFQFGDLIPELTLVENVELPLRLSGAGRDAAQSRALEMLSRLEIGQVADRMVNEVSGGQAQRAAVARALVHKPAIVFADEPTGSLDTLAGELVLEALVAAAREHGTAMVLVTHEPRVAAYAAREGALRAGPVVRSALVCPAAPRTRYGDSPSLPLTSSTTPSRVGSSTWLAARMMRSPSCAFIVRLLLMMWVRSAGSRS